MAINSNCYPHATRYVIAVTNVNLLCSTDLFVLSTDQSTITIYTWKQSESDAKLPSTKTSADNFLCTDNFTFVPCPNPPHIKGLDFVIENVVPGDFTYDGKLDVLVMGRSNPNNAGDEIKMRVYKGNGNDTIGKDKRHSFISLFGFVNAVKHPQ
jgi:hypothetical protein